MTLHEGLTRVIEDARDHSRKNFNVVKESYGQYLARAILASDVIAQVKAAAWEEGYRSGYIEGQADAHRLDPDDIEETPNPYADSPRHNAPQRREEQS